MDSGSRLTQSEDGEEEQLEFEEESSEDGMTFCGPVIS